MKFNLIVLSCYVDFDSIVATAATFVHRKALAARYPSLVTRRQIRSSWIQNKVIQRNGDDALIAKSLSVLEMAVTPVGPFCPFRSSAAIEVEPNMEGLNQVGPDVATDLTRIQLDIQMGVIPDSDRLLKVATNIEMAVQQWETLLCRLQLSNDFQTREYGKLTQAHLESSETSVQSVASMMRWQASCMRSMAQNTPPPLPPPDVDLTKMMEQAQRQQQQGGTTTDNPPAPPSLTAMIAAEKITSTPFTGKEAAFDSPTVKEEYEQLCRDHMYLIEFGGKYDEFDPTGKLLYLDEIEKIQERWDVFFSRFQLLGILNDQYIRQCNAFLSSMNMTEEQYKQLLKRCHDMMREDADAERNQLLKNQA